jgi:O-antigen ligase
VRGDPPTPAPAGSKAALAVLVALVVFSPWPFGSVHLRTTQAIALVSLATALGAVLHDARRRPLLLPQLLLWPLLGLWTLAVFQLVPLPAALHHAIAPGSAAVWHPDVPAAAAVLGPGPHPVSLYPEATRRWLALATGLVALALAAAPALRARQAQIRAAVAVVTGALLVSVYGFAARLAFGDRLFGTWTVPTVAPFGPFVSKNHFAGYVELAALLAVGLATGLADEARRDAGRFSWIDSRRAKWIVLAWGAAAVLVLAVPVSLSRGGVVSLAAGLSFFVLLRLLSRSRKGLSVRGLTLLLVGFAAGAVALVAVLPTEARDRVLTLAGITSDRSGAYRLALWGDTLRLAASSPAIGSGFGAYEDAIPRFKTTAGDFRVQHAENDHLEFLAEGGLLGTLLGGVAVLIVFLRGLLSLREGGHRLAQALLAGSLAGLAALYVHSAFDFNLRIPSNALMAALLVALGMALSYGGAPAARRPEDGSLPAPARPAVVPRVLAVVLAVSLLGAVAGPWTESRWDPTAVQRAAAPDAPLRRTALETDAKAFLQRRPAHAEAWVHLAWLRLPASREQVRALARWGLSLDPEHEALARAAVRLREAAR